MVNPNQSANNIFRTIKKLNPKTGNYLKDHILLLAYPDKELMVLVFKDLNRANTAFNHSNLSSDDDFNDAILVGAKLPRPKPLLIHKDAKVIVREWQNV